ncbi:MAG TPA: tetratricopeptide repeat protein [Bryobacteraceae bacterium]|nr:tetratricopeptide repeat protein [Bryobacteraceae bacterium]
MSRTFSPIILVLIAAIPCGSAERDQLDFSPSLFAVMAAMNAAGYDAELTSPNNDPLREQIRHEVESAHPPVVAELKKFFEDHRQKDDTAELAQYLSFALSVKGPPDFAFKYRDVELPPDVRALEALGPLLTRFSREADLDALWKRAQPAFERALERYHAPVSRAILEANAYLRNPTAGYLGRTFQIYLDLLGAPNQVQTRSYANEYFVVVTPSAEPRVADIRHAYLHYLLDPQATKYGMEILKKKSLEDYAQGAPALDPVYKSDFLLLATESLIKAVEARLPGKPESVDEALREGYILTPYFAEQLTIYEKQPEAMRLFFPEMIKHIDPAKEDQRLANVKFADAPRVRAAKVEPRIAEPPSPAELALEAADRLYSNKDYDRAKQGYLRVIEQNSEKFVHAKAYYGLARIAVLQKDPELGERLFQKVLDSGADPWTTAWTHVYLGRLSDIAGNRDEAAKHYQTALAVDGASAAARHAAEQGIQQSFKKEQN